VVAFWLVMISAFAMKAQAPNPANAPASVPAGMTTTKPSPQPPPLPPVPLPPQISASQSREADDAYLAGAKQVQHKKLAAAILDFERAVKLNPNNRDYTLALLATRENRITELVQSAARARKHGDKAKADALLAQARAIDPDNPVVAQHFESNPVPDTNDDVLGNLHAADIASTLAGPIELEPLDGAKNIHLQGDAQTVIRGVYRTYGIDVTFDSSYASMQPLQFDLDKATYADATRVLGMMAHCFAVPVQPKVALIAKDTQENRDELSPLVEETVYLPGLTQDQMTELANLARNVFDVKQVTASSTGGYMLLRGDEQVLKQVNATYADMLDGGSEVLFDVDLYEIDTTKTRNIGATLPTSIGAFDILSSAQNLINQNGAILSQAIAGGVLTLSGSMGAQTLEELIFLVAAGVTGSSQFTNLLARLGTDGGLPLLGLSVASGSSFALALNSTDARMVDAVKLRSSNHQVATFRAGTRYPVVTAIYSTPSLSGLAATAAAAGISAATIAQYGGAAASASVPQFQFEDLGITLKMTPQILHSSEISLALDMKIEALAGGTINSIPILNNRALTSTINVPAGHTALLATLLNTNETKALDGLPGLSELPGFQGTDQDVEKDSTELLITITPHIVRTGSLHVTSKRLAAIRNGNPNGFSQ
jgi:Flp pilus assembly secretin CpaC/tetratricopeptide (TPR) repeat protein